jgi:hypothetical protein
MPPRKKKPEILTGDDVIVRPRMDTGVDWSRERVVLARKGRKELWWMRSGKCWSGRGCEQDTVPAGLCLANHERRLSGLPWETHDLTEGRRLSDKLISEFAAQIGGWLDITQEEVELIKPRQTVVFPVPSIA